MRDLTLHCLPYALYRYARDKCGMSRPRAVWKVIDWWLL